MTEYEQIVEAQKDIPHFQKTIMMSQQSPLVYQYRNFTSFWQILKSDSFWATNARFSNDEAEQQFGMKVISSLCNDRITLDKLGDVGLDENYIICFCMEDDKLSQWRGYAPEGGVAMGFDFGMPRTFSVLNNDVEDISKSDKCVVQYVGLDAVRYIDPQGSQTNSSYSEYCREQLALINPATLKDVESVYRDEIQKKAPYIKHSGFVEEDECRLVFRNKNGILDSCIRYRNAISESLRYPYIVVKAALPEDKTKQCVVRVCTHASKENMLVKELEAALKIAQPTLVQGCHLLPKTSPDAGEPFCTGCVLRHWLDVHNYQPCRYKYSSDLDYEYFLHEDENSVVISQGENQKDIFDVVYQCIQNFNQRENTKIKVWCEGHLPLRKITVGPCPNQKNVAEAIRHYCKHTYWLRDVEIILSTIPFRKSL